MGVKSFFDPRIRALSGQQDFAYNLLELVALWCKDAPAWHADAPTWQGTPSELFAQFAICQNLLPLLKDWTVPKVAKSLATLARIAGTGIEFVGDNERRFRFVRNAILKTENPMQAAA